ncbi:MAG: phage/plasmid replication protein, II/X family [Polynucleobacter sp.]|uniref:phage/plasmid replication protein, II/X family n=1 Tax=Polynucleobacter sp. TaxID=2029855 RepID=UPI00271EF63C|nr:phage/plasmid replication protein, II/X family [Polynucleobacter sp.]MDO8713140.1 phage/plasmid replication protein, II/X family [Polynucleobacter sp.]
MAYDTIKLKSPSLDRETIRRIEQKCVLRSGLDMDSGTIMYELFSGQLLGSWDSRISVIPKYEDYMTDKNGTPRLHACEPYLIIEASVHKVQHGHNVYGGPTKFLDSTRHLINLISELLEEQLPIADVWTVHRVDVAHVFDLPKAGCKQFFDTMQLVNFPRRQKNAAKYDMGIYFPGKTTTVKFYHKGSEFKIHDYARLRSYFKQLFTHLHGADDKNVERVEQKLKALQRLADKRLRVEVEIHSDKFQYDFGKNPMVQDVTDDYLEARHDAEIERLLREGKQGMTTVRTTDAVCNRLHNQYGQTTGNRLFGFWQSLCTSGDEKTKIRYSKTVYYRNRKALEDVGVSWLGSDIVIVANDSLIHDFTPMRVDKRFCSAPARNRPEYHFSRDEMRLAA